MPSVPCYASTQSEHSTIIILPSPYVAETQMTVSGLFDFGHIITVPNQ